MNRRQGLGVRGQGAEFVVYVVLLLIIILLSYDNCYASSDNGLSIANGEETVADSQPTSSEITATTENAADSKIVEFLEETSDPNDNSGYSADTESDGSVSPRDEEAEEESSSQASFVSSSSSEEGGEPNGSENMLAKDLSDNQIQVSTGGNTGAAVTSIPIVVPPGRNGIQPNISLNYNSNRKNGWIGVGWSLDMGFIQRNTKRSVIYTDDDYVASVNGAVSELTPRSDWGANRYGAKIEGAFSKYYKISDTAGWIVTTKDGTKYYYGSRLDGSSRQDNSHGVFKWCLDKVEDTNGNYMEIFYTKDQGDIYLDEINYTGNTNGLSPANSIKFLPDSIMRTDAPTMYTINSPVTTVDRLGEIEVYGNGQLARRYVLSYGSSSSSKRSLLQSVTLVDSGGVDSLSINFDQYTVANSLSTNYIGDIFSNGWITNAKPLLMADVDGDGDADAVGFDSNGVKVSQTDCGSYSPPIQWVAGYGTSNGWTDNKTYPRYMADVNGDGKADVVGFYSDGVYVSLSQSNNTFTGAKRWVAGYGTSNGWTNNDTYPRYMADVNGDGKADVVGFGAGGVYVSLAQSNNTFTGAVRWVAGYGTDTGWEGNWIYPRYVADVNGDGKADVVGILAEGVYVSLSTGTSFTPFIPGQPWVAAFGQNDGFYPSTRNDATPRYMVDVNGDGMADVIGIKNLNIYVSLSKGNSFKVPGSWGNFSPWKPYGVPQLPIYITDADADGKQDMVTFDQYGIVVYKAGYEPLDALKTVTNFVGGKTTIKYKPSSVYANDYLPFIVPTVSSVEVEDDDDINTPKSITKYKYESGFFDVIDREFRGFGKVIKTTPNNTITTTEYYTDHQNNYYKSLPKEQTIEEYVTISSSNIYTRSIYTYDVDSYAEVDFPYLVRKDDYIFDGNTTDKYATSSARHIASEFWYDNYGNITTKYFHGDENISGDEKYEYTYYAPYNTVKWILSLPKSTYIVDGNGHVAAQKWFTYYPNTTNLYTVEAWNNDGPNPVTIYEEYDPYGNPKKIRNPRGNLTKITYDTTAYTYPSRVENALGHRIERTYDYRFGKVHREIDANEKLTTYDYDGFGRIKTITKPAPYGITEYFYNNFGDPSSQHIREEAQDQAGALIHWKETYFDGLGRTTTEKSGGVGTAKIVVDTTYNLQGLVETRSYPYYEGAQDYYVSYFYDPVDRLKQTDYPDGTSTTISYDRGRITYIDANGHKKVAEKDAYGRIIAIEEYTGNGTSDPYALYAETLYWYDVLNNLEYVRDSQGNETYITYDSLSRKASIYDPDMGLWEYDYDDNGNLIYQKDQMDRTIRFEYDKLNRVTLKNYPTGTDITYTYDEASSTNAKGRLTTVTDSAGTTVFNYDAVGQITRSDKTLSIDASTYTTQTQYDPLGRVKKIIYPDSTYADYSYDDFGNIEQIISGATTYVDYDSYSALGKPLLITFGNGVTTQYQYYPENNRLKKIYSSNGTTPLMNLEYFYDYAGNITLLTDSLDSNKTRSYKYDDVDRLIEADSVKYGGKVIYQYDKIGNITYNCRLGHYYYEDANHVHAVTSVRRSDGTLAADYRYDGNGNMIESNEADDSGILIQGKTRTFTYDYDNMPTSIARAAGATVSYYDAFGMRATKTVPVAGTTKYIGQVYECNSASGCTRYIFSGIQRMAEIDGTGTHYYHTDHLGSSTVMTDNNGAREREVFYYPYGEMHLDYYTNDPKYLYTGKEYDAETGLYYYGARYYDPKLARFISADTIVPEPFYPQSFNRYSYSVNNPIVLKDIDGHCYSGMPSGYTPTPESGGGGGGDPQPGAPSPSSGGPGGSHVDTGISTHDNTTENNADVGKTTGKDTSTPTETPGEGAQGGSNKTNIVSDAGLPANCNKVVNGLVVDQGECLKSPDNPEGWHNVLATREGLVGEKTATGHEIQEGDIFVALPDRSALNKEVEVLHEGNKITAPVWDVGPWNTKDPYWQNNNRPQAESGIDMRGRETNGAGIDLSNGAFRALGLTDNDRVYWRFRK